MDERLKRRALIKKHWAVSDGKKITAMLKKHWGLDNYKPKPKVDIVEEAERIFV